MVALFVNLPTSETTVEMVVYFLLSCPHVLPRVRDGERHIRLNAFDYKILWRRSELGGT